MDTQNYIRNLVNLIHSFNCHFTTLDSAVNRCNLLSFLFHLTKYHHITGWNLLISSHMMQRVLLSEIKLCSTLTSMYSSDICQSEIQCACSRKHAWNHLWKLNKI